MIKINDIDVKIMMLRDELSRWGVLNENKIRRATLAKVITEKMSLNEVYQMVLRLRNV